MWRKSVTLPRQRTNEDVPSTPPEHREGTAEEPAEGSAHLTAANLNEDSRDHVVEQYMGQGTAVEAPEAITGI